MAHSCCNAVAASQKSYFSTKYYLLYYNLNNHLEAAKPHTAPVDSYFSLPQRKKKTLFRMITFCSNKLIFKGKILFPPPKIFVK